MHYVLLLCIQFTFQTVISTDGNVSFAAFIYANLTSELGQIPTSQIGFNAGDGVRMSNIMLNSIEAVNVFRVDGTYVL